MAVQELMGLEIVGGLMPEEMDKTRGRINEKSYCDLPEGHRTTFVVGMSDMLERMSQYLDPKAMEAFEPLLEYARHYESDNLREAFDEYIAATSANRKIGVASSFLSMLIEKSELS
jgi:hypothetical protein